MSWRTFRQAIVSKRAENESNHSRRSRNSLQAAHGASGPDIWPDESPARAVAIVSCPCRLRECSPQAQDASRCSSPLLPSVPSWKCCNNVYPIPQQCNNHGRVINCSCDYTTIPKRVRVSRGSYNTTALMDTNVVESGIYLTRRCRRPANQPISQSTNQPISPPPPPPLVYGLATSMVSAAHLDVWGDTVSKDNATEKLDKRSARQPVSQRAYHPKDRVPVRQR